MLRNVLVAWSFLGKLTAKLFDLSFNIPIKIAVSSPRSEFNPSHQSCIVSRCLKWNFFLKLASRVGNNSHLGAFRSLLG